MPKHYFEGDSELDSSIRYANPFPIGEVAELDDRAMGDLNSILADSSGTRKVDERARQSVEPMQVGPASAHIVKLGGKQKHTRRWVLGTLAAVAAGVLVAVPLGSSLSGNGKAVAAPLPPIEIKATSLSVQEAVDKLVAAAKANPDPANFKPGYFDVELWEAGNVFFPLAEQHAEPIVADGDIGEQITTTEVVSDNRVSIPTMNEIRRAADGSGSIKQTIGEPYSSTGEAIKIPPFEKNMVPGSVETIDFTSGKMESIFPGGPKDSPEKLYKQISDNQQANNAAVGDGAQGFIQTMGFMMADWRFDQKQSEALIRTMKKISGVEVLGTSKDRWGRDALVFGVQTASDGGQYKTMVMFDPESGRATNYVEEFHVDRNPLTDGDYEHDTIVRYIAVSE
ncbi:hypothetical protein [Paeniglutamicibacter antarcticus]|uniref:Uncharacterized protein n=1 Tax=Paeniglutamicibacter antarcticus TaxID=494023 RepID=A0ABP9TLD9_9MICC